MFFTKLFCFGLIFALVIANTDFDQIDSIFYEQPCSRVSGFCVIATDCPAGELVSPSGLCPQQQSKGVECCQKQSVKETRCKKFGGDCTPKASCPPVSVSRDNITDCKTDEACCIYL